MRPIKNIVFEGGGVLGMAYAGAIQELENQNILHQVERVAGTSAGALMAMLVSLRYDTAKLKKVIDSTDFHQFEDHFNPLHVATHYGIYRGDFLLEFIQDLIYDVTKNNRITFKELHEQGYRELKVFACNLNTTSLQEFSHQVTPDVIVAEAIRASMSIPLFFHAWQFSQGIDVKHLYVDGGTIYNYPINTYDLSETLGFFFQNKHDGKDTGLRFDHPVKYVEAMFSALLKAQKIDFHQNSDQVAATVFIDTHGISSTDFKLSAEHKTLLYESGMEATKNYFNNLLR